MIERTPYEKDTTMAGATWSQSQSHERDRPTRARLVTGLTQVATFVLTLA